MCGDALSTLRLLSDNCVDMCLTSPPYYALRNYGVVGQIGQEQTIDEYIASLLSVFEEVRRVLSPQGTLWLNIGDTYCGTGDKGSTGDRKYAAGRNGQAVALNHHVEGAKAKDMLGIPWRLAFALRDAGWFLRQDIIWHKPNVLPSPVKDRCTSSYEHVFLLSKNRSYYFDSDAIKEPAKYAGDDRGSRCDTRRKEGLNAMNGRTGTYRNKRDVWSLNTEPYKGGHYACFPQKLAETCIMAGCPVGGLVLDPFMGAGTTAVVASKHNRFFIGIDLNPDYIALAKDRLALLTAEKKERRNCL